MKYLVLISALILSAISSKATNFSLVIATTDTAYARYYVAANAVDTDNVHITSLGARPTPPIYDSTNANHSSWVTSASSWDSSSTALQDSLAIHISTKRAKELLLLATIGYQTAFANTPVNQWIMVQGGTFPTVWIGYAINTSQIVVVTSRPTDVRGFPFH